MPGKPCKGLSWSDCAFDPNQNPEDSHEKKSKGKERSQWDRDVQALVSSSKWLQRHGLKRNKLSLSQILSQIGFQHRKGYVATLGKFVASRYADGMFPQLQRALDGSVYNLTASKDQLLHFVGCLMAAIELYQQRLEWLTSHSPRLFGVIQEQAVGIVMDFGTAAPAEFELCLDALATVLVEQVTQIATFNLIRAAQDLWKWQQKSTPVSEHSVQSALTWLWELEPEPSASHPNPAEALLEAMRDEAVEAVYYFSVGDVPVDIKQLLLEKVSGGPCPVNVVSFNAREEETILFLKELSCLASGRFHAFAEQSNQRNAARPALSHGGDGEDPTALDDRSVRGQVPLVADDPEDVFLIWKELEEARSTVKQVQKIISESYQAASPATKAHKHPDKCLPTKQWLKKHGLKAQKLTLYDALADCAFHHSSGLVGIKTKPGHEASQTDAETKKKVINAKYCDKFVQTLWKDGSVVHIHVSTEKYKRYEEKMRRALSHIEGRIQWLLQGSRGLFGNVFEDEVYILIDTSQSMHDKLPLVKEKIFQLIQEQLRYKKSFNFVQFSGQAVPWQEKLTAVNEEKLQDARLWIKGLEVGTSTNTLQALQIALADPATQAVYLLTDGRPDQPPQQILAEVQQHCRIPIHTVSFNCDDREANQFLFQLSTDTQGRFHYHNIYLPEPDEEELFLSEDLSLLKKEMEQGERDLEQMKSLHAKCLMLDCSHGENEPENSSEQQTHTLASETNPAEELRSLGWASAEPIPTAHQESWQSRATATPRKKALQAAQTKTSLLQILIHGVKSREESLEEGIAPEKKSFAVKKRVEVVKDLKVQKAVKRTSGSSLDISSALWLKTHGLVARRLTIMDVLAPTAVPHGTKYIPVLDKHVASKVFDEVLPLAYLSNNKKQMTLINPQAVNLDAYKEKLEQAIKSFERRLNLLVWRALTQEERDKFIEDGPVQYMQHKEVLLAALENLGWPISYEDVTLLEDEILAALTYKQQASDLQEAAKKESQESSVSHRRNHQKRLEEEAVKPKAKKRQKTKVFVTHKSQKVIARSDSTGFYYPATVIKNISPTCALVGFSTGETCVVPVKFTIPVGGAMPCPNLQVGDYVFARAGTRMENEYYGPAIVTATPKVLGKGHDLYTVLLFNNRQEHCVRSKLIKISPMKYEFSCQYIRMVQEVKCVTETPSPYPHSSVGGAEGEEAKRSPVKEGGQKKKKRAAGKRHSRERMVDSYDLLLDSRKQVKHRGRNSLPSSEEVGGSSFSHLSSWHSSSHQILQWSSISTSSSPRGFWHSETSEKSLEPDRSLISRMIPAHVEQQGLAREPQHLSRRRQIKGAR